jgi:hypothetical protein
MPPFGTPEPKLHRKNNIPGVFPPYRTDFVNFSMMCHCIYILDNPVPTLPDTKINTYLTVLSPKGPLLVCKFLLQHTIWEEGLDRPIFAIMHMDC